MWCDIFCILSVETARKDISSTHGILLSGPKLNPLTALNANAVPHFFGKYYEKTLVNNYKIYEFLNVINITFTVFKNVTMSTLNMEKTG